MPTLRPQTPAGPTRDAVRTLRAHGWVPADSHEAPYGVPAGTPQDPRGLPGQTRRSPRGGPGRAVRSPSTDPPGYLGATGGGWYIPTAPRVRSKCALCHRRTRQLKGLDAWTGEAEERLLCAPCQRALRRKYELHDRPAPICPACSRRPREIKGTRRGRRRYFALCAPCLRSDREERGLPAYRGRRGVERARRSADRGVPRRPRHRAGRTTGPRPEWLSEAVVEIPDPADRPIADRAAKKECPAAHEAQRDKHVPLPLSGLDGCAGQAGGSRSEARARPARGGEVERDAVRVHPSGPAPLN